MLNIQIETDPTLEGLDHNKSVDIITYIMQSERIESCDISIIFGNKKLLQELKNRFFNIDNTTDVIAFRLNDYQKKDIEGEIYICLSVAKENAEYYKVPYQKEIARLIIHGGLHLIGYQDGTKCKRQEMQKLEDKYLEELKY